MIAYTVPFIFALLGKCLNINVSKDRKKKYLFITFFMLIFVAVLKSPSVGTDMRVYYSRYYPYFQAVSWSDVTRVTASQHWELFFCLYCKLLCLISVDPQFFVAITSILCIVPFAFFIYRNSSDVVFSTCFYIGFHIYTMLLSPARQALAIAMLVGFGYERLKNKNYIAYGIIVVLASLVHTSALVALILIPLDFINFSKKSSIWLFVVGIITVCAYSTIIPTIISRISPLSTYSIYNLGDKHAKGYITIHTISSFFIPLIVFILYAWYHDLFSENTSNSVKNRKALKRIRFWNKKLLIAKKLNYRWESRIIGYALYLVVLFRFFAFVMNVAARLALFFMPFIMIGYPMLVSNVNDEKFKRNLDIVIYSSVIVYFFYILIFRAESLWGILPYYFFWQ